MGVKEILGGLKDKAQSDLASANEHVNVLAQLETEIEGEMGQARADGFQAGLEQGSSPGDKIFSQEELDARLQPLVTEIEGLRGEISAAVGKISELDGQIVSLQGQLSESDAKAADLQTQVDTLNGQLGEMGEKVVVAEAKLVEAEGKLATAGEDAVKAFKAEVKAKFEAQQAEESAAEAELNKMFEEPVVVEPAPEEPQA